jgi:hypothetical protein
MLCKEGARPLARRAIEDSRGSSNFLIMMVLPSVNIATIFIEVQQAYHAVFDLSKIVMGD